MIFLTQKTIQPTTVTAAAGVIEGAVKSYMGPEPDMNSSLFMNPVSNLGLSISSFILTGTNVLGANPLPNLPDN